MTPDSQSMIGISHPASHLRITAELRPDSVLVVRVRGQVDSDSSRTFDHYLRTRLPAEACAVVVDTADVTMLCAHGIRTMIEHTDRLALHGNRLLIVQSSPHVRRVLEAARATANLNLYDTLELALRAFADPQEEPDDESAESPQAPEEPVDQLTALRHEIEGLRVALRTKPVVARALGVVQGRYHLESSQSAFEVVRDSAQHHNLRMYTLAQALLNTTAPQGQVWFPGRARRPAPSLSFVEQSRGDRGNRGAVLSALLHTATGYVRADAAAVQVMEQPANVLRMELSSNMSASLANQLAGLEDSATTDDAPIRVIVPDIGAGPEVPAQHMLLDAGIRAMYSTPLLTDEDEYVGVVTTYHARCGFVPTRLQCARLDHAATEVATWLDWHSRTVVFDALEHVHASATSINWHISRS